MKEIDVTCLANAGTYKRQKILGKITETHISWVILSRKYAFKIKKPVRLSFLNFSTIQHRKRYCEIEMTLNSRFSNIYLSVEPIRFVQNQWRIGKGQGDAIDYCVVMKRLSAEKRMDVMLQKKKVNHAGIKALAKELGKFHKTSKVIVDHFDLEETKCLFREIIEYTPLVSEKISLELSQTLVKCSEMSDRFLELHADRMQERIVEGFKRDVHGDLHCGNIFLYRVPILFDCIEFKDGFRQIDILYEIAFLCMDIESYEENELSDYFVSMYLNYFDCLKVPEDHAILIYYKCLRANIRAKVHAVSAAMEPESNALMHHIEMLKKYLVLMNGYSNELTSIAR